MKKTVPFIVLVLAIFYSCQKEDLASKMVGTYYGAYTTPTDSFSGNLYITSSSTNKMDITLLIDSGSNSITVYNVGVNVDDHDAYRYDYGNTDSQIYTIFGTYYFKPKILMLVCFTSPNSNFKFVGDQ